MSMTTSTSSSQLRLPKIKDIHLQKEESLPPIKHDKREIFGLYGPQVGKYHRALKSITSTKPESGSHSTLKLPNPFGAKPNVDDKLNYSQIEKSRLDISETIDRYKAYGHARSQVRLNPRRSAINSSSSSLDEGKDWQSLSFDQDPGMKRAHSRKVLTPLTTKGEKRKHIGRSFKEAIENTFKSGIAEVHEPEETVRKDRKPNVADTNLQNAPTNPNRNISITTTSSDITNSKQLSAESSIPSIEQTPQNRQAKPTHMLSLSRQALAVMMENDPVERAFNRHTKGNQNLSMMNAMQKTSPTDPEKVSKLNLDKIYDLQEKLLILSDSVNDLKEANTLAVEYLQLVDNLDYLEVDQNPIIDPQHKLKIKKYLLIERMSLWLFLLVSRSETKADGQYALLDDIVEGVYYNFLAFVDFVMSRFISSFKQHKWHAKFRALRERKGERSENFGARNEALIRCFRSNVVQSPHRTELLQHLDSHLEKLKKGPFDEVYLSCKLYFADYAKKWKVKVKLEAASTEDKGQVETKDFDPVKGMAGRKVVVKDDTATMTYYLPALAEEESKKAKPIYSLVLDLDETLIHYEENNGKGRFFVRPYAEMFLKELAEHYEITVFTAAVQDYADTVLNILDKGNHVKYRLYRHHTQFNNGSSLVKDLSKIGRELCRTIIVDNSPDNFRLQQDNGIEIKSWYSDPYDCELLELIPFLKDIVLNKIDDVRFAIRKYKESIKLKQKSGRPPH